MLFDTHCHLDDPQLQHLFPGVVDDARAAGIAGFVVPAVAPQEWQRISTLARSFPCLFPAFGVHPMHADQLTPVVLSELRQLCREGVGIGEIGLDYAIDSPSREIQKQAFRAQLRVARGCGLPVLLHCRKAFDDLLTILKEEGAGAVAGVMHAFSGSPEIARDCLRLGLYISLAGPVTYANAVRPVAVAKAVPMDRLLLETDAPDLAPEPFRGGINLPTYLLTTARKVAELRGVPVEEVARATTANAARLFRLQAWLQAHHSSRKGQ